MTPERWKDVEKIFNAALEQPVENRSRFLEEACASDKEIRDEVESLLSYEQGASGFIESPAMEVAAEILAKEQKGRKEMERLDLEQRQVGPYAILRFIGAGGMGQVFLAKDTRLGRRVALKILSHEVVQNADLKRRFQREARAASYLNHPNIITIFDVGESEGTHYMATEFIHGRTLRQTMTAGSLSLKQVLTISIQIAGALVAAHQAGIIHRDIKPENVMIRHDSLVKVLDFGLAKLIQSPTARLYTQPDVETDTGVIMGTMRYMSPEQARGQKIDFRTDLFSFGIVLYEMISGQPPFQGITALDTLALLISEEPPPLKSIAPHIPQAFSDIVEQALQKDPQHRFQNAQMMLSALKAIPQVS